MSSMRKKLCDDAPPNRRNGRMETIKLRMSKFILTISTNVLDGRKNIELKFSFSFCAPDITIFVFSSTEEMAKTLGKLKIFKRNNKKNETGKSYRCSLGLINNHILAFYKWTYKIPSYFAELFRVILFITICIVILHNKKNNTKDFVMNF